VRAQCAGCPLPMTPHDQLDFGAIRVLDGAMATELERRGCDLAGPLWSARMLDESPRTIAAVHLDYLRSGADCIGTASYQVSALGYHALGLGGGSAGRAASLALRSSVEIACEARCEYARENARRVWIAISLGPYGAALHNGAEYHGQYHVSADALIAFHAERLAIAAETKADIVALETIPSREEAEAIQHALAITPKVNAWISFTCRDAEHVAHGEPLKVCAEILADTPQVTAIGINCTAPTLLESLIGEALRGAAGRKPVIVYPNSGETWDPTKRAWRGHSDTKDYGAIAARWFAAGAQAVGGCCRTGPEHIRAVAAAAERLRGVVS
jgi:homocysteine S-methyltransferase